MSAADEQQNWRQFHGTELGSLLSSIYGGQRKVIKYPTLARTKAFEADKQQFRPVNSTLASTDPTKATRNRSVHVAVPKSFGRSESKENVPYLPSRKHEETIRGELDELYMRQRSYRPAHVRPQGEAEKDRYSQICAYKGGKALPKGLVMPAGEAPFEAQARLAQQKTNDEFTAKRRAARGQPSRLDAAPRPAPSPRLSVDQQMASLITAEIDERVAHLEELRAIGGGVVSKKTETQLLGEINARIAELERLEL